MPNVAVCYKWAVDESDIRVEDDLSVNASRAQMKISDYDRNAIQAGVELAARLGGEAIGLTFGDDKAKRSVKDALSRGLDELVWINGETGDAAVTAEVLAAGVAQASDVALVVTAEGSSDQFNRQTAPRMAALLGWPCVTCATRVDFEGAAAVVVRRLEDSLETVRVALPAVISVMPEMAEAPLPGLKAIMQASKKPSKEIPLAELAVDANPASSVRRLSGYASDRKNVMFEGDDAVAQLVLALRKEGVLQ